MKRPLVFLGPRHAIPFWGHGQFRVQGARLDEGWCRWQGRLLRAGKEGRDPHQLAMRPGDLRTAKRVSMLPAAPSSTEVTHCAVWGLPRGPQGRCTPPLLRTGTPEQWHVEATSTCVTCTEFNIPEHRALYQHTPRAPFSRLRHGGPWFTPGAQMPARAKLPVRGQPRQRRSLTGVPCGRRPAVLGGE